MSRQTFSIGGVSPTPSALHPLDDLFGDVRAIAIDGYSPDQRFFLNYARSWRGQTREQQQLVYLASDPHAPDNLRAIAPPSNMPSFAKAFSCKAGDAMVRPEKDRVVIW